MSIMRYEAIKSEEKGTCEDIYTQAQQYSRGRIWVTCVLAITQTGTGWYQNYVTRLRVNQNILYKHRSSMKLLTDLV